MEELEKENIESFFLTSKNRDSEEGKKIVKSLAERGTFNVDVLIATAVLDVGVSIKDPKLNQIFIRSYNEEELIQMLGRVRVPQEKGYEGITLFLCKIRQLDVNRHLGEEREIVKSIELAREQEDVTVPLANGDLDIAKFSFLYPDDKKMEISSLAVYRHRELFKNYKEVIEGMSVDPDFFLKKQLGWLGLEETYSAENYADSDVKAVIKQEVVESLEKIYLDYKDKELFGHDELKELLEQIKPLMRRLNAKYVRSNATLSLNNFNNICKNEMLPYFIDKISAKPTRYMLVKCNE